MTLTAIKTKETTKTGLTSLGLNKVTNKRPIGIISYNNTNGRLVQCEVFTPFWEGSSPDMAEMITFIFSKGYSMIRANTLAYNSLV